MTPRDVELCLVSEREGKSSWERFCFSRLRLLTSATHVLGPSTRGVDWISILVAHMQQLSHIHVRKPGLGEKRRVLVSHGMSVRSDRMLFPFSLHSLWHQATGPQGHQPILLRPEHHQEPP